MAFILYDQGKKLGEVENWVVVKNKSEYKNILGKQVLAAAKYDECSFVSPKPVERRSSLVVIENGQFEYQLKVKWVEGTTIKADITSQKKI